tara:strand:+ start:196 stop:624 length:429 start_codon:yes stop_codon:yes gene_type:complete
MKSNIEKVYSRLPKTELASQKVELKVGDELKGLAAKVDSAYSKLNKEIDDAFTPIRQIENLADKIPSKIDGFKEFSNAIQKMEVQFQKDTQKVKDFESELGMKIQRPKALDIALSDLQEYQQLEQLSRDDINEFSTLAKKYR